jgi:hypothetical protein
MSRQQATAAAAAATTTRHLAEALVDEDELPEMKRRRLRGPRPQGLKRHEFLMSMEPFKMHNPGGGPFVGPPAARTESTGHFVPIPSSFQFREEDMIHFDDKLAPTSTTTAPVAAALPSRSGGQALAALPSRSGGQALAALPSRSGGQAYSRYHTPTTPPRSTTALPLTPSSPTRSSTVAPTTPPTEEFPRFQPPQFASASRRRLVDLLKDV